MFIAMNRFKVAKGQEEAFEDVWRNRQSRLADVPGFKNFHLLKGASTDDHTLYASHTIWASHGAFEDWTRSEHFRMAHKDAGQNKSLYLGPPEFEGFHAVLEE